MKQKSRRVEIKVERISALCNKYREVIMYLIFGVLTTLVNIVVYFLFDNILHIYYLLANAIAWILSVLFAYETNRRWVFASSSQSRWKEFTMFVGCRLLSGVTDMVVMFVFVDILTIDSFIAKLVANVIVVIMNYIFSKFLIFN